MAWAAFSRSQLPYLTPLIVQFGSNRSFGSECSIITSIKAAQSGSNFLMASVIDDCKSVREIGCRSSTEPLIQNMICLRSVGRLKSALNRKLRAVLRQLNPRRRSWFLKCVVDLQLLVRPFYPSLRVGYAPHWRKRSRPFTGLLLA
jgi:hypothetical protein